MAQSSHVRSYLHEHGPERASVISDHFMSEGVKYDAARKRIQRAPGAGDIQTLSGIKLPHNEDILYTSDQYNTVEFWRDVLELLRDSDSSYAWLLDSLKARGGMVLKKRFPIASGRPERMEGQIAASRALENLVEVGFLEIDHVGDFGDIVRFSERALPPIEEDFSVGRLSARLTTEDVILKGLKQWGISIGLVSPGQVEIAEAPYQADLPKVGQFNWDLTAPSYTRPLATAEEGESVYPGFIVADVLFGKRLQEEEVQYFVEKCAMLRSQDSMRPFMGLLIGTQFSEDALYYGRSKGLLFTTPRKLFGEEVGEAMEELLQTLQYAGEVVAEEPTQIGRLLNDLSRIEGAAQSIRGPLFEMLAARCIKEVTGGYVEVGRIVTDPKKQEDAEIDVFAGTRRQEALALECKGVRPGGTVGKDTVQDWVTRQVPRIRNWLLSEEDWRDADHHFEIWTTGEFSDEARDYLRERRRETGKYNIDFKNGAEVRNRAAETTSSEHLVETLNQHYLQHPLTDR